MKYGFIRLYWKINTALRISKILTIIPAFRSFHWELTTTSSLSWSTWLKPREWILSLLPWIILFTAPRYQVAEILGGLIGTVLSLVIHIICMQSFVLVVLLLGALFIYFWWHVNSVSENQIDNSKNLVRFRTVPPLKRHNVSIKSERKNPIFRNLVFMLLQEIDR